MCPGSMAVEGSSTGEISSERPLDVGFLVRLIVGVDFEAKFAKVAARSCWCNSIVKIDRRDTRLG